MKLRRLTAKGIDQFSGFLDSLNTSLPQSVPTSLLDDQHMSSAVEIDIDLQSTAYASRFELAKYLDLKLTDSGLKNLERDVELWSWLALFNFDQLCPVGSDGNRKPGERARFVPAVEDYRKYYRHLVAGPYSIYRAHRDVPSRALAVLAGPLNKPGDIAEQLASRQEIVTNRAAMALATTLYIDPETSRAKEGCGWSRTWERPQVFADVLNQFDLTWDLYAMQMETMLKMLPSEFARFL